jgi:hypothetical protein
MLLVSYFTVLFFADDDLANSWNLAFAHGFLVFAFGLFCNLNRSHFSGGLVVDLICLLPVAPRTF